jgi:hypothetical protein
MLKTTEPSEPSEPSVPSVPSVKNALATVGCSVCDRKAFVVPTTNDKKINWIHVGHLCRCMTSGGSVICMSCYQKQENRRKKYMDSKMSWFVCKVCNCYIKCSSKDFFHRGESIELANALVTQARFRSAFPNEFGSIQANGPLSDFFGTFKSLGGDENAYERFAIVLSALFAQSSRPRFFPMPEEGFFSRSIHTRMLLLTMARKLFFKFHGISCDIHMFKLGYSERKFSHIYNTYGIFLRMILKRILARFYLLQ